MVDLATTAHRHLVPSKAVTALAQNSFYKIARSLDRHSPVGAAISQSPSHDRAANLIEKIIHDESWLNGVKKHYSKFGPKSHIDYSDPLLFSSFDTLYFFKNLFKACTISAYVQSTISASHSIAGVIDLGCGSGVFGLSWYQVHQEIDAPNSPTPFHVIFVDKQPWQLRIASSLAQTLNIGRFSLLEEDVFETSLPIQYVRISSYLFCGQSDRLKLIDSSQFSRIFGAVAIIVDYEKTLADLQSQAEVCGYNTLWIRLKTTVPSQFLELTRAHKIEARALMMIRKS
jgi:hypothetical protein